MQRVTFTITVQDMTAPDAYVEQRIHFDPRQMEALNPPLSITGVAINNALIDIQQGKISIEEYRARCEARFATANLSELSLHANLWKEGSPKSGWRPAINHEKSLFVIDGDALCCACSRSNAAAGKCHRAWAAPFLQRAGWTVVLDGVELR